MKKKGTGNREQGTERKAKAKMKAEVEDVLDQYDACDKIAVEELAEKFEENRAYFEKRIEALNRRACLHKGKPCAVRARAEIHGMLTVLNALGFEAVGFWENYDEDFTLMPAAWIAEKGGAK